MQAWVAAGPATSVGREGGCMRGQDSATLYLHSPPRRLGRWRGGLLCFACAQGRLSTSGRGAPIGDRPAAASVGQTAASRPDGLQSGGAVATPWVSPCALACRVGADGRLRLSPSRRRDVALAPVTCVVACARSRRCFPRRLGAPNARRQSRSQPMRGTPVRRAVPGGCREAADPPRD